MVGIERAEPQKEISNIDMRGWVAQRWSRKPEQLSGLLVTKKKIMLHHTIVVTRCQTIDTLAKQGANLAPKDTIYYCIQYACLEVKHPHLHRNRCINADENRTPTTYIVSHGNPSKGKGVITAMCLGKHMMDKLPCLMGNKTCHQMQPLRSINASWNAQSRLKIPN